MQDILKVEKFNFSYDSKKPLLKSIEFVLKDGEKVALLGANGTGKSTLMKLMMGLIKPSSGEMYLKSSSLVKTATNLEPNNDKWCIQDVKEVRKQLGYVFQNADDQLFCASVFDDVAFGVRNHIDSVTGKKLSIREVERRTLDALSAVEALHLKDRAPYNLSGGEKRAVAIATVLSMQPRIILMDEPSTALDPHSRRSLIHLLKKLFQTLFITTHDLELALEVCDRVLIINHGIIVADGPPLEVLSNSELLTENRLEMPYSLKFKLK